jgi:hypothetical protein
MRLYRASASSEDLVQAALCAKKAVDIAPKNELYRQSYAVIRSCLGRHTDISPDIIAILRSGQ